RWGHPAPAPGHAALREPCGSRWLHTGGGASGTRRQRVGFGGAVRGGGAGGGGARAGDADGRPHHQGAYTAAAHRGGGAGGAGARCARGAGALRRGRARRGQAAVVGAAPRDGGGRRPPAGRLPRRGGCVRAGGARAARGRALRAARRARAGGCRDARRGADLPSALLRRRRVEGGMDGARAAARGRAGARRGRRRGRGPGAHDGGPAAARGRVVTRLPGLEIAAHEGRVARGERGFGTLRLTALERRPLASPAALPGVLAELARTRADVVLTALPAASATHRFLTLPFRDRGRLPRTAPLDLPGQPPLDPAGLAVACEPLGPAPGGSAVLAAAVRRDELEAHGALLAGAGLAPARVDLAPLPAWNLLPATRDDQALVVADGGESALALRRGGRLAGLRPL